MRSLSLREKKSPDKNLVEFDAGKVIGNTNKCFLQAQEAGDMAAKHPKLKAKVGVGRRGEGTFPRGCRESGISHETGSKSKKEITHLHIHQSTKNAQKFHCHF